MMNTGLPDVGSINHVGVAVRYRTWPRFTRIERHNHLSMVFQSNTVDDALGRVIMEFMRRGR